MKEQPCRACGEVTGGNLRLHRKDCSYVLMLSERYPQVKAYVNGGQAPGEGRRAAQEP